MRGKKIMITQAQRAAVEALELPFVLSDDDIQRQFAADGTPIARETRNPMARARELARSAMESQAAVRKAA
jgi:hypothetical protein